MEGPGMSLFQGAGSIHINNSAQDRLEEQEELEDQKRRDEELKHKLKNAFDDLLDDDEASSVNSSGNFTLDAPHNTNGTLLHPRSGLPTYVESLSHLKEAHIPESPYNETPNNHHSPHNMHQSEDTIKIPFSPYGAGDGQNQYYHQEFRGHLNGGNHFDARQDMMNYEQLKVMYEMRIKECQQLASQLEQLDTEVDSLRARLGAAINDKDKAELSLQEAHHLLASSKHSMIELEQQVTALREKLIQSDEDKEQLKMELRSANIGLQDVQQRLHTIQVAHTHDTDALFREQQDRHREEMDRLQNDFIKAKNRLAEKENEIKILEKRCLEKDREKDEMLIEKGATINRLASELEAAQSRLVSGESVRLKERVSQLSSERNSAKEQVKELGSKLEVTAHELVLCRSKLANTQKEYDNWRTTLHQILLETLPDSTYIGEPPSPGKLSTLKEVLSRYKLQIQKLATLQEEITKRDKRIEQYRKQENEIRLKIEEHKGVEMQLTSRIAVLQNKLELLGSNSDSELLETYRVQNEQLQHDIEELRAENKNLDLKICELECERDSLQRERASRGDTNADLLQELQRGAQQLKDALRENGELKALYLQACSSRDAAIRELKDIQTKIQKEKECFKSQEKEYVERIEKERQQIEKLSTELSNHKEELERANKRISELQKEFTEKQQEFNDQLNKYIQDEKKAMRKEIETCLQCEKHLKHVRQLEEQLSKCSLKLAIQESNETLMKELKSNAEYFQQYIVERFKNLNEERRVTSAEPADPEPADLGVNDLDAKTVLMMKEKAIRDQIAEKFTLEMKTMEMNFARKIKEIESSQLATVVKLKELLERKAKEVETLKDFILNERTKVSKILESKENEISILIKEHNELQNECQKACDSASEWRHKAEKYKDRVSRLGSLEDVLKSEREDLRQRSSSNAKEWQALKTKLSELQAKLMQVEEKYDSLKMEHITLQDKYKNAKKTVLTYKDYITKKDTHVNNEMSRIQEEYRKIFMKLQNQINYYVSCRVQEERNTGRKHVQQTQQEEVTERMNKLSEEFAELTRSNLKDVPELHKQ